MLISSSKIVCNYLDDVISVLISNYPINSSEINVIKLPLLCVSFIDLSCIVLHEMSQYFLQNSLGKEHKFHTKVTAAIIINKINHLEKIHRRFLI
jgi:hypothetical protein